MPTRPNEQITEGEKQEIRDALPEIENIKDERLRDKVICAWAMALKESSCSNFKEFVAQAKEIPLVKHLRAVANIALGTAAAIKEIFPEISINEDILLAGALCHDLGKLFEHDPENKEMWQGQPWRWGRPAIRHPVYGVHMALKADLPLEVVHIVGAHSGEGELINRSLECTIVNYADHVYWHVIARGKYNKLPSQLMGSIEENPYREVIYK